MVSAMINPLSAATPVAAAISVQRMRHTHRSGFDMKLEDICVGAGSGVAIGMSLFVLDE
jgi:hypothetical protein